jgi:hypothetical protein
MVPCPVDEPSREWIEHAYERLKTLLGAIALMRDRDSWAKFPTG